MKSIYKRFKKSSILAILFVHLTIFSFAKTYYVSNKGYDSNNGTSTGTSWSSLSKVNSATLVAGDSVLFKCGDSWYGTLVPKSGSSSGQITYGSYGLGEKPLIHRSILKSNTGDWIEESPNIWKTTSTITVDVGNIIFNDESSVGVKKFNKPDITAQGQYWHDAVNNLTYIYSNGNPAVFYSNIKCVLNNVIIEGTNKNFVTIDGLATKYGAAIGISFSNSSNVIIKNCDIAWIGGGILGGTLRYGNGIQFWQNINDALVENCRIWECYDAGLTNQYTNSSTTATQTNIIYRYNVVWDCEYSFEYFNRPTTGTTTNIFFEYNTCSDAGGGWGHSQRPDPSGFQLRLAGTPNNTTNFIIRNNIFDGATSTVMVQWGINPNLYNIDYNCINKTGKYFALFGNTNYSTFETYKAASGYDVHSIVSDPLFADKANKVFSLLSNSSCIDAGDPALPYDPDATKADIGAIYFEHYVVKSLVTFTEYKSICDGSSYNGWTVAGKYERTLTAKAGGDSIVTTYLTVNPKYAVFESITINAGETYNGWSTSGTFARTLSTKLGCDSVVTTNLTVESLKTGSINTTQTIALKKGYNMISTYVAANDPVVSTVTQPIVESGDLIKIQDEAGNSYENWGSFGGWINNLGAFQTTEGYKIKVAEDCTLQITGLTVALPLDIPLNAGWNIISFPRTDVLDAMTIIQPLINQNKLIKVQDEAGNSIEDWGVYGGWKNGIGNFVPGKAYRVKLNASAVLTIQESYPKSALVPVIAEKTNHFIRDTEGNGVDHMNINLIGLREAGLAAGDELAAFDGDVCVGTLKISESHLNGGSASLVASAMTGAASKDGFKDGSPLQVNLWKQQSGAESKVALTALKGSLNFQKSASILVQLKSLTTKVSSLSDNVRIDVYPNPTQGRFTVRFSTLPENGSHIDVLDLSGRKVASRIVNELSEEINLAGQAAGLYLVKSVIGTHEKIQKLVLQ